MLFTRLAIAAVLAAATGASLAQSPPADAAAAPAPAVAADDPDMRFKGKMGGTFGKNVVEVMPAGRRIAVAAFRVGFVTANSVSAQVRASYLPGRDRSGARSSLQVGLTGVDAATMQAITDKAYADLLAQLAASGREVVPADALREHWAGLKTTAAGHTKEHGGQTATFFAPTGMPLVFTHVEGAWGDGGMLDLGNYRKLQEISARLDAVVIAPVVFVNFARMSSSGNQSGLVARSAETGAELVMSVGALNSVYIRTEEFRNGMLMKGDEGSFQMEGAVASPLQFATMQEVAKDDNAAAKGIFDVLGKAAGLANAGGAARSSSRAVAETTNDAYAAAAADALNRLSVSLGQWFRKYPPAR